MEQLHDAPARIGRIGRLGWPAALVVALVAAGCAAGVPDPSQAPSTHPTPASDAAPTIQPTSPSVAWASPRAEPIETPARTVKESGGFRLEAQSSASCTADAPAGWTMSAPERSDRADLISPDGSVYAGYGIQPINTSLAPYAAAYDAPLDDPDLYSTDPGTVAMAYGRIVVGAIGGSPDLVGDALYQATPHYLLATVQGSTHGGAIFFHGTGFPGDGVNYAYSLPMYFAFATTERWSTEGPLVARIAASIRCTTRFQPPDDYPIVEAGKAGSAGDENGDEYGYNPQLGTEYANDPGTGENYLVDPSLNWSETGPDGPGYYVPKGGGDYGKLEPGRID